MLFVIFVCCILFCSAHCVCLMRVMLGDLCIVCYLFAMCVVCSLLCVDCLCCFLVFDRLCVVYCLMICLYVFCFALCVAFRVWFILCCWSDVLFVVSRVM